MADDIGDLLDEVERKFCSPKTTPTTVSIANPHGKCKTTPTISAVSLHSVSVQALPDDEDLEQIISEIISDADIESASKVRSSERLVNCSY